MEYLFVFLTDMAIRAIIALVVNLAREEQLPVPPEPSAVVVEGPACGEWAKHAEGWICTPGMGEWGEYL